MRRSKYKVRKLINDWLDAGGDWKHTSYNKIARELKLAPGVVYERLPKLVLKHEPSLRAVAVIREIKRRYNKPYQLMETVKVEELNQRITALIMQGWKINDIVDETGVSRSTIYRRRNKMREEHVFSQIQGNQRTVGQQGSK